MSWSNAIEAADSIKTGTYLKVAPGEAVQVIFVYEPTHSHSVYDTDTNERVREYIPEKHKNDPRYRVTSRWDFQVLVLPHLEEKTFSCGLMLFKAIRVEHEKKRLGKYVYEIAREGSGTDTRWHLTREDELTAEQKQKVKSLSPTPNKAKDDDAPAEKEDDLPF